MRQRPQSSREKMMLFFADWTDGATFWYIFAIIAPLRLGAQQKLAIHYTKAA
jgi:hypothetical protein